MTTRKRVSLVVALGTLLLGGLAVAWSCNHWELEKMALIGETAGPIVGVLSLAAVIAGLWSVRIQRYALELQRRAMIDQQDSVNTQLDLQRQELAHQRDAVDIQRRAAIDQQDSLKAQLELQRQELAHQREVMEAELRYRRHTALRDVYVPFIVASDAYLSALRQYHKNMIRTAGKSDPRSRLEWQKPCEDAYAEFKRAYSSALLVDTSKERHDHRWPLARKERLEPWIDTPENQADWSHVVLHRISERTHHHCALRDLLQIEFGATVLPQSEELKTGAEDLRADLKAKARAIEQRIGAQLDEAAREEAIRNGWMPPGDPSR